MSGQAVGLDVTYATVEPRLLSVDTLQYLALLDPAAALAGSDPKAQLVILIDAVDEALRLRDGNSVLDWLERSPELPPNVRVILTCRPHSRINTFQSVRSDSLETIDLGNNRQAVIGDTRIFATRMVAEPSLAVHLADAKGAVERISLASDGNFAYLTALEKGLLSAVADGNLKLLDKLLKSETLPKSLGHLYSVFLRNARDEISRLGELDVERPRSPDDEVTAAWEGVGHRMVSVLAVAKEPMTIAQMTRLGSIRVWKSAAESVLQRLRPLLDEVTPSAWRFFHQSVAEFLTRDAADEAPDLLVEGSEWHWRVVRAYKGSATGWSEVNWETTDDYGLLHVANHLAELDEEGRRQVIDLVNVRFRNAIRNRFLNDLPFKRVVENALAHCVDYARKPGDLLASAVFLSVVHSNLNSSESRLAPAVFGLMARIGRVREALARTELLPPGEHRFNAVHAVVDSTPVDQRHLLGDLDGAELLVAAALEVPIADVIFAGSSRARAVATAARALAPHDLGRAMALANDCEMEWDPHGVRDGVLRVALRTCSPSQVLPLIKDMVGPTRAAVATQVARRADSPERERLLEFAENHADEGKIGDRIRVLAGLIACQGQAQLDRAEAYAAKLRSLALGMKSDEDSPHDCENALLDAAETVLHVNAELAIELIRRAQEMDSVGNEPKIRAVRLWEKLGYPEKSVDLAKVVLDNELSLGWYGPAAAIAELAVAVDSANPDLARHLADAAEKIIDDAVRSNKDPFEKSRIDMTIDKIVDAFRTWAPERALRNARLMDDGWTGGVSWDFIGGRLTALACLGIDVCEADPGLARALLKECGSEQYSSAILGRHHASLVWGNLFRPKESSSARFPSTMRAAIEFTFAENCNYRWMERRERLPFTEPADVARSVGRILGGVQATWASVIATAVPVISTIDLDVAIDLCGWLSDPGERLIALAGLISALKVGQDPRKDDVIAALGKTAIRLPQYISEIGIDEPGQARELMYLNPSARARWEAALRLPPDEDGLAHALARATGSRYLVETLRTQKLVNSLLGPVPEGASAEKITSAIRRIFDSSIGAHDPIQLDLVRMAAVQALMPWNSGAASFVAAAIEHSGRSALAQIYACAISNSGEQALDDAIRSIVDAPPEEINVLYKATAAAIACARKNVSGNRDIVDRVVALLEDVDASSAVPALAVLAAGPIEQTQRVRIVRVALQRVDEISNKDQQRDVLADLLAPAALSEDVQVVIAVVRRLLDADWSVFMEGLRRAVTPLVSFVGETVFSRLDWAFRSAQAVVGATDLDESPEHLDGVASPSLRTSDSATLRPAGVRGATLASSVDLCDLDGLYLDNSDLPGMSLDEDSTFSTPGRSDYAFAACDGISTGMRVWLAEPTEPIWRLHDIRYVFPDSDCAAAYQAERLFDLREGVPSICDAPEVGQNCHVFGGTQNIPVVEVSATMYFYVFQVESVVVKLFVAQGFRSADPLDVGQVHELADRIFTKATAIL
ncbi:hypothetical protein ACIA5G_52455 [Amycolatopsis sp. NPDC051758]|uniref:hypothetical protein n=1 Tax=Amycolatopsis sp. NPDC051758 TaxID=3363935 RepID=UPI0037A45A06